MTSIYRALRREVQRLRHVLPENGARAYLRYRLARLFGCVRPMALWVNGHEIAVRPASPDLDVAAESLGSEFGQLRFLFPPDQTGLILDAGGYIGTAAIALARHYPKATIVSLEPSSDNAALHRKNTAAFPNIHLLQRALVAGDMPDRLSLGNRGTGHWGFTVVPDAKIVGVEEEAVETITMAAILDRFDAERFLIAKIDIEGAEAGLLQDDTTWLAQTDALFIELHERIVAGVEAAFFDANRGRCIIPGGGEKFLTLSPRILGAPELSGV